jgi:lipopolysaccharide biosynthesis glycosyltransferase
MRIPVVLASDNNYAGPLAVTLVSIMKNATAHTCDFYILVPPDFSTDNENKIKKLIKKYNFSVIFIYVKENRFENINITILHITTPTFYRLLIPQLLPDEIEKCLYLDVDVIVTKDLGELFNTDLTEYYVAGVKAIGYIRNKKYAAILGLPDINGYINAGVLLMNLKLLRSDNIVPKFLALLANNYPSMDQDIINVACFSHIKYLPLKYNAFTTRVFEPIEELALAWTKDEVTQARQKPVIIHYADKKKPWNDKSIPWAEKWWKYCRKTMFFCAFNREYKKENLFMKKINIRQFLGKIRRKIIRILLGSELFYNLVNLKQINENLAFLKDTLNVTLDKTNQTFHLIENNKNIIIKQVHESPAIQEINTKTFAKYRSLYRGRDIVIAGSGPTLNHYEPIENAITIGVNTVFLFDKIKLDYLFIQDNSILKRVNENTIIQYPCKKFFSFVGTQTWCLPVKLRELPDVEEYCRSTFGIYNVTAHLDICKAPLADFGSVIFPTVQFALWTYPERIYIVGCDCSAFAKGHFDGSRITVDNPVKDERFIYGWEKIKEFQAVYYPDVEIISVNPQGLKGMFKDVFTESYLAGCNEKERNDA